MGAWIETPLCTTRPLSCKVTSSVGAWIETCLWFNSQNSTVSHPAWVRGLKRDSKYRSGGMAWSHPVWVRGLKRRKQRSHPCCNRSHPVWVSGLKLCILSGYDLACCKSHPMWVRGLKLISPTIAPSHKGRTPCGCVD